MRTRPPGEFADLVRICTHWGLSRGCRPPKYSKLSGMLGASQIEVRPNPLRDGSVHVKAKCSPRRSLDHITTCRWASTLSSNETASLESYVRVPITGMISTRHASVTRELGGLLPPGGHVVYARDDSSLCS